MSEKPEQIIRRELKSPRAAAIAGIIYTILMFTGMILTTKFVAVRPETITKDWLDTWSATASLVITFVPFAGIAFLWFTGVVRDLLGELEDRFFSTIFFGSGIIQVSIWFVWGGLFGALVRARALAASGLVDNDIYIFGFLLMGELLNNYGLRMAGLYMTAIATLWTRTGTMPRWLTIVTYILALTFLIAAERIREARFIFPLWVFVVSMYVLIINYRRRHDEEILQ